MDVWDSDFLYLVEEAHLIFEGKSDDEFAFALNGFATSATPRETDPRPIFQYFTDEEFFEHAFRHERSDLRHWRKRLGGKLELLLAQSLRMVH